MKNIQIFTVLIAISFVLIVGIVLRYTGATDVSTSVEITNEAPTVDTLRISTTAFGIDDITTTGITPVVGTDRVVHVTGAITDLNGKTSVASSSVSALFYRTSKTSECLANENNCYHITTCDVSYDTVSDTELTYNCPLPVAYYTDATDAGSRYASDNWTATVTALDEGAASASLTVTTEVNALLALNIPNSIPYGTLSLGGTSADPVDLPLAQRGNTRSDVQVSGTDMTCGIGVLDAVRQRYSLNGVAAYDAEDTKPLTDIPVQANLIVPFQVSATPVSTSLFWRIAIPQTGIKGDCLGANTITLIALSNKEATYFSGAGNYAAAIVEGELFMWGSNEWGQLGLGDENDRTRPTRVGNDSDWKSVAMGAFHALAIKENGDLYAWGYGGVGQLGLGSTASYTTPQKVTAIAGAWQSISAGANHSLALHSDGAVYVFGRNVNGELGLGDTTTRTTPTAIDANTYTQIDAGFQHSVIVRSDGAVFSFGQNHVGQLCNGEISASSAVANPTPVQIAVSGYEKIVVAAYHTHFLMQDSTLSACGYGFDGRLGTGSTANMLTPGAVGAGTGWLDISGSMVHNAAKKSDGWYVWGSNREGSLGLGDFTSRTAPTFLSSTIDQFVAGRFVSFIQTTGADHKVVGTGGQTQQASFMWRETPTNPSVITDWSVARALQYSSAALRANGTLWTWGYNESGELGIGSNQQKSTPQQVGTSTNWVALEVGAVSSYALNSSNQLFAWGNASNGRIGDGTFTHRSNPVQITGEWSQVFPGFGFTFARTTGGVLYGWGYNCNGQLGIGYITTCASGEASPVKVNDDTDWQAVSGGGEHALATKSSGALYAWGAHSQGRTGLGLTSGRALVPTLVDASKNWTAVAAGSNYSLGIADGALYAWGYNNRSQLGLGNTTQYTTPQQVGSDTDWVAVVVGKYFETSFALKSDGTLWSWGRNANASLCQSTNIAELNVPTQIGTDTNWASIASGKTHTVLRKTNGSLYTCGSDFYGQIGIGNMNDINTPVTVTPNW